MLFLSFILSACTGPDTDTAADVCEPGPGVICTWRARFSSLCGKSRPPTIATIPPVLLSSITTAPCKYSGLMRRLSPSAGCFFASSKMRV